MLLNRLVEVSSRVAQTSARLEKIALLAGCLREATPDEAVLAAAYLTGDPPQGRIGIGPATLSKARPNQAASESSLTLRDVDRALDEIVGIAGAGSQAARTERLGRLLARATRAEQNLLIRLLMGELRQGALEGVMVDAVAKAARVPARTLRRALMFSGELAPVARAALTEGKAGLSGFGIQLFRPVKPMLASSAEAVGEALAALEAAALEYKLDGARVQVHKAGNDVRVFTRKLNEVTAAVPELIESVAALAARELVLDGEVLALRPDGRPQPFQMTMRRFGRKLDVAEMRRELPLSTFFFDCLFLDGQTLVDEPTAERVRAMAGALPAELCIPRLLPGDETEAERFLEAALAAGHEGVMAKDLAAPYQAGRRGKSWIKVKPVHTLDLVILAAEWGHGRRRGWLSNLHLGARDPDNGGFVMLGKTFKGLTDETLAWQTKALQDLALGREGHVVHVEPKLVAEIAFNDIQASPRYPGGLALRFARVKRYRKDKGPDDADTIDAVRAIYAQQVA